jgi:AraC-like DNA-binding protein
MRTFKLPATAFPFNITRETLSADYFEHGHEFYELVAVTAGTARHLVNGVEGELRAGDVVVINSENTHEFRDVSGLSFYNVVFPPETLTASGPEIRRIPGFHALFVTGPSPAGAPFACKLHLTGADRVRAFEAFERMWQDFQGKADGYEALVRAEFVALAVFLSRRYGETGPAADSAGGGLMRLANAVSHMEKNFADRVSLEELAAICGLSVRQFTRLFRTYYGTSPMDYVIGLRIERAMSLLRDEEKPVTEIALETGFYDSSTFCRYFRKYAGQPPDRYRKANF